MVAAAKLKDPRAGKFIERLKKEGFSYSWIEHRMGRPENWAKQVVEGVALVTEGEVEYLENTVLAIMLLPKPKTQGYAHRAKAYAKNALPAVKSRDRIQKHIEVLQKELAKYATKPKAKK